MSASIVIGTETLSKNLRIVRTGSEPAHTLVRFPGMSGEEVLVGSRIYASFAVTVDIEGSSVADVESEADALEAALYNLKGASTSSVVITFGDASSVSINYCVQTSPASYSQPAYRASKWYRTVQFTFRQVR